MAFFTRPRFNIPPLPADDVWELVSVMWLNMKYLCFFFFSFFLSSWSTKIFSKATGDVTSRLWRLKAQRFHIFRNICVIIVNTNTLKMHSYRRQRSCSFPFWGKWLSNNLPLYSCMTIFCLCLQKAGRREQKSVWTNSLYCNLFYSTFPWRK